MNNVIYNYTFILHGKSAREYMHNYVRRFYQQAKQRINVELLHNKCDGDIKSMATGGKRHKRETANAQDTTHRMVFQRR